MAREEPKKSATYYIQRLFEDEYVQEQLRAAAGGLRSVYERARKQPAQAAEDKKLYDSLRQAAVSTRRAATALRRPEPEPAPKHRLRYLTVVVAVLLGSVLVIKRSPKQSELSGSGEADASGNAGGDGPGLSAG